MDDTLRKVILTLNTISVRGADDMSKMLGCIQALQSMVKNPEGSDSK